MTRFAVAHRRRRDGDYLVGLDGREYRVSQEYGRYLVSWRDRGVREWAGKATAASREDAFSLVRRLVTAGAVGGQGQSGPSVGPAEQKGEEVAGEWNAGAYRLMEVGALHPTRLEVMSARRARATGLVVLVARPVKGEMGTRGWYTVCQDHAGQPRLTEAGHNAETLGYACWDTRLEAKQASRNPVGWCEACADKETAVDKEGQA